MWFVEGRCAFFLNNLTNDKMGGLWLENSLVTAQRHPDNQDFSMGKPSPTNIFKDCEKN